MSKITWEIDFDQSGRPRKTQHFSYLERELIQRASVTGQDNIAKPFTMCYTPKKLTNEIYFFSCFIYAQLLNFFGAICCQDGSQRTHFRSLQHKKYCSNASLV